MADKKICPIMSRPVVKSSNIEIVVEMEFVYCLKGQCRWWDEKLQDCRQVVTTIKETIVLQP